MKATPSLALARVCPERPIVASWIAYAGHTMYVGVVYSKGRDLQLNATNQKADAAGFPSVEACIAALEERGWNVREADYLRIGPLTGTGSPR